MLSQKFLDEWIGVLVPEEYGPEKEVESGKPLLGIYLTSAEEMEKVKNLWYPDASDEYRLQGQIVDIGKLAKKEYLEGKYVIRINSSLSEAGGIFALLHEIGHLVGLLEEDPDHEEDPDEYADNYAFRKTKELIQQPELRMKTMLAGMDTEIKKL
jgi:hypothetical protein